jgi:hypothetical protein
MIILLVILIIIIVIDKNNNEQFMNMSNNYANVDYNTRMDNGVETVIPHVKNMCKNKKVPIDNNDVRERYLARNVKFNQTIPKPNNIEDINNVVDSNNNNKNRYNNDQYDNIDIKSLNSMMSNDENNSLNDIDNELLTLN